MDGKAARGSGRFGVKMDMALSPGHLKNNEIVNWNYGETCFGCCDWLVIGSEANLSCTIILLVVV